MELLTPENIKSYFTAKDYKFFDTPDKKLNINIIGVRRDNQGSNTFDDFLLVMYREEELMINNRYQITTDPGKYWLLNPMNPKGTAILVPGQYRSTWQLGKHQSKYEALVQRKPVKVYRDNNKDAIIDYNNKNRAFSLKHRKGKACLLPGIVACRVDCRHSLDSSGYIS